MAKIDFLNELNNPQREAVEHLSGPLLVLAGAGSGKTRVITFRIAHAIATGAARPNDILAITFTNKAADEMKKRINGLLGSAGYGVWISTFHSLCARILRDNAEAIGYKRSFTIYDEAESLALIKKIYKNSGIPDSQPSPGVAQNWISRAKDELIGPGEYSERADIFTKENAGKIYKEYQRRLKRDNAMDFDDLLMNAVGMFESNPEILDAYQNRFRFILVDEYQDTNHSQYKLVSHLAESHRNICVVGDDDQSIYAWRGANIRNILDFEQEYPECKVIKLVQNYRSTQAILDAAGEVISKNFNRKAKKLFTEKIGGDKITMLLCGDEIEEAEAITEKIRLGLIYDKSPADFAILYRTNAQSRVIEDSLRRKGIAYKIVGGIRFYERAEVKDILAYLRLLVNPADSSAFLRIINVPKRGIGKTTIDRFEKLAATNNLSLMEVLPSLSASPEIRGKAKIEIDKFLAIMQEMTGLSDKTAPNEIAARIVDKIGYLRMLDEENSIEAEVRADNVKELVAGISEYCRRIENPTLAGFLEEVSLLTDIDSYNPDSPGVTLMTLHSAKGLEYDTVFIAGMEDGLFPLQRNSAEQLDIEEERRLCYVGITRARNKLFLSMAGFRRRWGNFTGGPSVFLQEIPQDLYEVERFNYWADTYKQVRSAISESMGGTYGRTSKSGRTFEHHEDTPDYDNMLPLGASVLHEKFGKGVIVGREGSGDDSILTIRFEMVGTKKIMVKYANLEIIG